MTRTTRHLMVGAMMTTLAGGGRAAVAAGVDTPAMGRVRSHHPGIASLIERAAERSKTCRGSDANRDEPYPGGEGGHPAR